MKTISAGLLAHLGGDATTLSYCIKLTRTDGQIFGFTDHDENLVISGVTYKSLLGVDVSNVETQMGMNVDTCDVRGMLDVLGVDEASIVAGRWDYCTLRLFMVNWADLSMGDYKMRRGQLGQISVTRSFVAEIRGITQFLQQKIGELYSPDCKANLFDDRCKVNPAAYTFSGTVGTVTSAQRAWTDSALTQAADYFKAGQATWLTGANTGLSKEVETFAGTAVALQEPMPYTIVAGDTYTIVAGCLKRFTEDCGTKFNNRENFRGMPFVPGEKTMRGP